MRRFHSYGSINPKLHYYAPRQELLKRAYTQLMGENEAEGGHYITVWAPRQTGKTWVMQQIFFQLQKDPRFNVLNINLQVLKDTADPGTIINVLARKIGEGLGKKITGITNQDAFQEIFKKDVMAKPLILILDEFDALAEQGINAIVGAFRNIYFDRMKEVDKPTDQKTYLLHAVALIGVRSVLGIENETGSPFNVQRSLHINNLAFEEVQDMFQWYEKESGQTVEPAVIKKLYEETKGQPGLIGWLGELLTDGIENFPNEPTKPIDMDYFKTIYHAAMFVLPSNNILNLISKAKKLPYRDTVIELFQTDKPMVFTFDDEEINYLYMNGIIEPVPASKEINYVKFASPLVQRRLFSYFSKTLFKYVGKLIENIFTAPEFIFPDRMDIPVILNLYQAYLDINKGWLFKNAPRRSDLRVFEAVFHFNLYAYLFELLREKNIHVFPEFPTGNGKIDLFIRYQSVDKIIIHGIELKSFSDAAGFRSALEQTAHYGHQLGLREIFMVSFVEIIDEANLKKFETPFIDPASGVTVYPKIIQTGHI